jgi:hypothetical protein
LSAKNATPGDDLSEARNGSLKAGQLSTRQPILDPKFRGARIGPCEVRFFRQGNKTGLLRNNLC